jgi:hypothetical protein
MKILFFGGGLGNQIFEYAFYLYLKEHTNKSKVYGIYLRRKFKEHVSGLEIDKIFDVKLPPTSYKAKITIMVLFFWKKIYSKTRFCSLNPNEAKLNAIAFNAFKTDIVFYEKRHDWLNLKKGVVFSEKNMSVIKEMETSSSVAIHVRRGDFYSQQYKKILGDIATDVYYNNALSIINKKIKSPQYFVFSDDIEWVRKNLNIQGNVTYINWNLGKDSYIDMCLMTHAKANIIANSTFSYWGAYLNKNNPLVFYPKKWINGQSTPNIFPISWIGL